MVTNDLEKVELREQSYYLDSLNKLTCLREDLNKQIAPRNSSTKTLVIISVTVFTIFITVFSASYENFSIWLRLFACIIPLLAMLLISIVEDIWGSSEDLQTTNHINTLLRIVNGLIKDYTFLFQLVITDSVTSIRQYEENLYVELQVKVLKLKEG